MEGFVWQPKTTMRFLEEYKKRKDLFRNPKMKKKRIWEEISEAMKDEGFEVSSDALDRKMRNMKCTYKTILENNGKRKAANGGRKSYWKYFSMFEDIFQDDRPGSSSSSAATVKSEPLGNLQFVVDANDAVFPTITTEDVPVTDPSDPEGRLNGGGGGGGGGGGSSLGKSRQMDSFRKRKLFLEEQKLKELRKLREAVEESNRINQVQVELFNEILRTRAFV